MSLLILFPVFLMGENVIDLNEKVMLENYPKKIEMTNRINISYLYKYPQFYSDSVLT